MRKKGIAIAVATIVSGLLIVAFLPNAFTPTYETKQIGHSTNFNPSLLQTYVGEFRVFSSEVQSDRASEVLIEIEVFDSGNDDYNIDVYCAIYSTNRTTYDSLNESMRDAFIVDSKSGLNKINDRIVLEGSPMTYDWVIWFEAPEKTSRWSVDMVLTMLFNWGLD
ncbi:MAG: hypothetical protein ACXABV_09330 [Candidatus Thorarchaeota archaeon]